MSDQPSRLITPFVRRRAWSDPRVRSIWLTAAVLTLIAAYLAIVQYRDWSRLNQAISSGVVVQAKIEAVEGDGRPGRSVSPGAPVILLYDYNGRHFRKDGTLAGLPNFSGNTAVVVGQVVPLHIDPADPDNWAARPDVP